VLVLLPFLCWRRCLCCAGVSIVYGVVYHKGEDTCESTAQQKHNKGKESCTTRVLMSAYQGQQHQHYKGNNTSALAQTCQLNRGNNTGAMTVMTPMRCEREEVSAIWMTMPVQQGRQHPCNVGDGTSAIRATTPS
jgi:hypothetical protein